MASKHLLLILVILSLSTSSLQDVTDNKVDSKDESPLADVAKEILKEKNLENIGGMVNSFIQSGGAKQIMDGVLQNLASGENSGNLLDSLGSLLNSGGDGDTKSKQKTKKNGRSSNGDVNPMELLSGIGSIVGALQGAGGGADGEPNPAALLQGLGSLLGGGNNQGGAALLQGLGSLLGSASQEKAREQGEDSNAADIMQGLGSVIGAAMGNQAGGDNNAGAVLQGLGSLLGGGQGGQGGINPEMIGNLINMFASTQDDKNKEAKPHRKKVPSEKVKSKKNENATPRKGKSKALEGMLSLAKSFLGKGESKDGADSKTNLSFIFKTLPKLLNVAKSFKGLLSKTSKSNSDDDSFDLDSILGLASTFLNQGKETGKATGGSSFMDYLPMILNTINSFTGEEAQQRANGHSEHSGILPPVLEKIHIYYDNFINSETGKYVMNFIGDQQTFKMFQDEGGNFSYNKFEELIENHSFRKYWIEQVTEKLVHLLQVISDEKTYKQYTGMGIMFANSLLEKSGFPKKALIDTKKPSKSFTNLANHAARKYLDYELDTREYVEPAVLYIQELLTMAHKSISPGANPKELTVKLTDTINMEIIEPITRVNRAYRFAKSVPKCDRYVFCLINQRNAHSESLPGLKKALYKGSSLIVGWFLSSNTGTPYWDLYSAITKKKKCNVYYHENCNAFHEEEIKATTEYVHSEL